MTAKHSQTTERHKDANVPGPPTTVAGLENPKFLRHTRREWLLERLGWCLIGCVILGGLLGGLGPGWLSRRTVANGDNTIRIQYEAIERYEAPSVLKVWMTPGTVQSDDVTLSVSRSFADEITIEQLVPPPSSKKMADGRLLLTYRARSLTDGTPILCRYKHDSYGVLRYEIGLEGQDPIRIRQLVLP
jgi:hypothetical protein